MQFDVPVQYFRPDIVCVASRYLQNPGKELLQRITRYIKGTTKLGLNYSAASKTITGWPDASWADNLDDRKSTGAYMFFIGSCLISWSSKKQGFIALSSNNAELGYIRGLVNELSPNFISSATPIEIFEDNEGTIAQANNNILNSANR